MKYKFEAAMLLFTLACGILFIYMGITGWQARNQTVLLVAGCIVVPLSLLGLRAICKENRKGPSGDKK